MMGAGIITKAVHSVPVFVLVCIVAVPMVLFRLFGVLFFASTTPMWALVPALTLGSLLIISGHMNTKRCIVAICLVVAYLGSVYFHGWADMKFRLDEGQSNWFDILEASLILVLVTRFMTAKRKSS